jgi:copper chaperone CopZ
MKTIYLLLALMVSMATEAQVQKVSLQASGLTCSMCSNAINKALKTLDFVDQVDADIKTYTFEITFKPNAAVDFDRIRKKVEDAGFSVSGFVAQIHFENLAVKNDEPIVIDGNTIILINPKESVLDGVKRIRVLDKGFVTNKEYKKNSFTITTGMYHATI